MARFKNTQNTWVKDLLILAAFFTAFYLFWLGSYPLFTPDEGRYSEVAREMIATGDFITPRVNGVPFLDKPILYYWGQVVGLSLLGVNEWGARLFPMLFGILGCLLTYVCGRHLFDRRTGLLSAIVLATTPLYFAGAHYADLDLEIAVLISGTLLSFLTAVQTTGKTRFYFLIATYIFAACAFLTKGLIGIAFPAMIGGSWILLLNRWDVLKKIHLIPGILLFLVLVLPWYVLVQKANPQFLHYFFVTQQVTRFLSAGEFNNKTVAWFYIPIILAGFFPWTIFLFQALVKSLRQIWDQRNAHANELFLILWFSIILIFFSIPHSKIVGYIFPVFPALALLVGRYLSLHWEHAQTAGIRLALVNFLIIAMMLASAFIAVSHYQLIDLTAKFSTFATIMATIVIVSALISFLFIKKKSLLPLFSLCTACSTILLLVLAVGATDLNQNTSKPLVTHLKTVMQPQDEVITYFKYYQDLPFYLGKRVTIVADWNAPDIASKDNWVRELWLAKASLDTSDWLIDETTFWQRFYSNKRVFVFLNDNYFDQFKAQAKTYFILGRFNDIILISNKPTLLASLR